MITPREAATIMLVRDGGDSRLEVFMLKRNLQLDFVGGAYVFPGGAVDVGDAEIALDCTLVSSENLDANLSLSIEDGALRFWVAAVRECFEESGIMLARSSSDDLKESANFKERCALLRDQLNQGKITFAEILKSESLVIHANDLAYFAHWITPEGAPRRYDTRFFVAKAPEGQSGKHDNSETVESAWITPQLALERHERGEYELVLPTKKNLEAISRFDDVESLFDYLKTERNVVKVAPRMIAEGNGIRIVLPGDPDF
ncbi:MAG: NUDIX hydrolase [Actinomycetota bacterium]|nr:NUDIX hydrolase [Actinomycetota bacterium]